MQREAVDIFISGAGPAGLIAAAALAAPGRRVLVADPGPDPGQAGARGDLRSTAFLQPARALFERLGLWQRLAALATPLEGLRIVDLAGEPPAVRAERTFAESGSALGWNFRNDALRGALLAHLAGQSGVEIAWGAGFAGLVSRSSAALITLGNGRQLSARLAIAADGRESPLRTAAGIDCATTRYGQKALAFAVCHERPHGNVSSEFYLEGGPFTVVPLPDHEGSPASAVVWMNDGATTTALAALDPAAFARAAERRSAGMLGALRLLTGRAVFPVITRRAARLVAGRVALIAEAAHVLPPIGAQGLNTSVADVIALAGAIGGAGDPGAAPAADPGAALALAGWERARLADLPLRAGAIDLYNRLTRSADPLSQQLRRRGLELVHDVAPLRRALIRAGMGPGTP